MHGHDEILALLKPFIGEISAGPKVDRSSRNYSESSIIANESAKNIKMNENNERESSSDNEYIQLQSIPSMGNVSYSNEEERHSLYPRCQGYLKNE